MCVSLRPQVPPCVGQAFCRAHVLWWSASESGCQHTESATFLAGRLWNLRAACPPLGEGGLARLPKRQISVVLAELLSHRRTVMLLILGRLAC